LSSASASDAWLLLEALSATRRLVTWHSGERDLAQQHSADAGCSLGEHSAALLGASIPHAHAANGEHRRSPTARACRPGGPGVYIDFTHAEIEHYTDCMTAQGGTVRERVRLVPHGAPTDS
jgi:hypothetical protein